MKKLFSNKSGFTLVEIIVAFAIFAILASMILSMVRITVMQRNSNAEFTKQLEAETLYLAGHYTQDTEKYGGTDIVSSGTETADGQLVLDFGGTIGSYSLNYGLRAASIDSSYYTDATQVNLDKSTIVKNAEGLNFFVAEGVTYNDPDAGLDPDNDMEKGGQAVTARADTRISGNRYIDYVWIKDIKVDSTYTGPGTRILIESAASPMASVPTDDEPYMQYRLTFCSPTNHSTTEITGEDGKTYERKVYNPLNILDCGYLNNTDKSLVYNSGTAKSYKDHTPSASAGVNKYLITKTSDSTVRVAIPVNSGTTFSAGESTLMYVIVDENIGSIDASYFGKAYTSTDDAGTTTTLANVVPTANGAKFYKYPKDATGATWLNIYGAFEYEDTEKVGDTP